MQMQRSTTPDYEQTTSKLRPGYERLYYEQARVRAACWATTEMTPPADSPRDWTDPLRTCMTASTRRAHLLEGHGALTYALHPPSWIVPHSLSLPLRLPLPRSPQSLNPPAHAPTGCRMGQIYRSNLALMPPLAPLRSIYPTCHCPP